MDNLTKRQRQILNYVSDYSGSRGYPPTVREIGSAVGLSSSSTVHSHLRALEKKGHLRRDPTKPRAIELTAAHRQRQPLAQAVPVPLVGQVAAGTPLLAQENVEDVVALPQGLAQEDSFLLRVTGESMVEAGILHGDLVVVRPQPSADNGDIVVALLGEEATVKRFYRENGHIRLQPENASMEPILAAEVTILGLVQGIVRGL